MAQRLVKRQTLNEFASLITKVLKENLTTANKSATGNLIKSINFKVEQQDNNDVLVINSESYLKYVDKGVSGTIRKYNTPYSYHQKKPPIQVISNWMNIKGIPQQYLYQIRNKIFSKGIKPTNVLKKTIDELEFQRKLKLGIFEEDVAQDFIEMAKEVFRGIK
jgi:hypothetical protein